MDWYCVGVVAALVGAWLVETLSGMLTLRGLKADPDPEALDLMGESKLSRARTYSTARQKFSLLRESTQLILVLGFLFAGGFNLLDQGVALFHLPEVVTGVLFVAALGVLSQGVGLPWDYYSTFVIEERFGFNTTSPKLWVADRVKSWLLALVLGGPLLLAVIWCLVELGSKAWPTAWAISTVVMLILHYIGPTLILPLFNTLTPLEQGPKREAIEAYSRANAIPVKDIMVMDGSKRSKKANAFFTGLWGKRRIVLFDTLVNKHSAQQLVAVLAHEAGHWKLKHIPLLLVLGVLQTGFMFWCLSLFLKVEGIHQAFGMERVTVHGGLVFFFLLFTPLSLLLGVVTRWISRICERAADRFAVRSMGTAQPMLRALQSLAKSNLSNPVPHGMEVALHHSHPPLLARMQAIREYFPEKEHMKAATD
ncbi:MAG: M48 family peptidase [Desulfovibrio sp.]|nr:MAG: M48 family peptidase [Desulfovibrio sp.]